MYALLSKLELYDIRFSDLDIFVDNYLHTLINYLVKLLHFTKFSNDHTSIMIFLYNNLVHCVSEL